MGRSLALAGGILAIAVMLAVTVFATSPRGPEASEGRDQATLDSQGAARAVEAYFTREGYAPGDAARLVVDGSARGVTVQLFRAGSVPIRDRQRDRMVGAPVTSRTPYSSTVRMGDWPSGVYFAELRSADGRVGYAPFVLAPKRLGEHRVAVVLPTNTWQAYNRRDADGDGEGDTWYEDTEVETIDHLLGDDENAAAIPVALRAQLRRSHFLLVGVDVRGWNVRTLLRRLWGGRQVAYRSWAVSPRPDPVEREFWRSREVTLVDARLGDYVETFARIVRSASGGAS